MCHLEDYKVDWDKTRVACPSCGGRRYVPAPTDNAWRRYFERTGQGHHFVSVPCPTCNDITSSEQK